MEEAPGISFRPTVMQRRVLEGECFKPILVGGRSGGRRLACEVAIVATAATPREAELALEDLRSRGIAMLDKEGRRIESSQPRGRFTFCRFDEEKPRTIPCLDCDEAGCEKCGGTGRRRPNEK